MKITRIKKLLLFILLGLLCASCNSEPNGKIVFKITWDKTEIYINEIVNVEITMMEIWLKIIQWVLQKENESEHTVIM